MSHSGVVSRDVLIMCVVACGLPPLNLRKGQLSADTFTPLTASLATVDQGSRQKLDQIAFILARETITPCALSHVSKA